ncbi:hypothetical protein NL676_038308 [Syzygium grande]|nr:hypothetical protein NL676_038308 [Syzygium grande]
MNSGGTSTDKASQDDCRPTKVLPTAEVNEKYRPLFEAVVKGDWKAAEKILDEDREAMTAKVMTIGETSTTLLDVAAMVGQDQLVENLVKRLPSEYNFIIFMSAVYHAARRGRIRMAKAFFILPKVLEDRSDPSSKSFKLLEDPSTRKWSWTTYWEVFVEQRQDLLKEVGQWMKNTSSTCSIVATIIIMVAFTAAFTIPGGNDGSTGIPIFLKKCSFMVFAVADALALFSSVTAALMFLAIVTSRYTIEDFLHSLPRKLILGFIFLFLSLAFILVAFSFALTIVLSERLKWIYILVTLLAAFPVVLFAILHHPLCVEMVESNFRPPLYRRVKKIWK